MANYRSRVGFVLPVGAVPGQELRLKLDNGTSLKFIVPEGSTPGMQLTFDVPAVPPQSRTCWLDLGVDSSESDDGRCKDSDDDNGEGPSYTSSDEDGTGPRILSPCEWRSRNVRLGRRSRFRRAIQSYRAHYFHNQRNGSLAVDPILISLCRDTEQVGTSMVIESLSYNEVAAEGVNGACFRRFAVGEFDERVGWCIGHPVLLTSVPDFDRASAALMPSALCRNWEFLTKGAAKVDTGITLSDLSAVRVRVSVPFAWGKRYVDGRLELGHYVRLVSQFPHADVPFYCFGVLSERGKFFVIVHSDLIRLS